MIRFQGIKMFLLALLAQACARIVPLSGGEQDVLPPRPVKYIPDSAARFFTGKIIRIRFHEYIQLRDPKREILISPPLQGELQVKTKGKWLIIKLPQEDLRPSTTYLVQFGNALADINEGNVRKDFFYVFSTGAELDSGSLSGFVNTVPAQVPLKGIRIMLYPDSLPDSMILHSKPAYFAEADENGRFQLRFLRPGTYAIAALKEENNNFDYDRAGEWVAFHPDKVNVTNNTPKLGLIAFREPPPRVDSKSLLYENFGTAAIPIVPGMSLQPLINEKDSLTIITTFNETEDSILIFFAEPLTPKNLHFLVTYAGRREADTLKLTTRFGKSKPTKPGPGRPAGGFVPLNTAIQAGGTTTLEPLWLRFPEPVKAIDMARIILWEVGGDTSSLQYRFSDTARMNVLLETPLKPGRDYRLILRKGAFTSLTGRISDSLSYAFKTLPSSGYSTLQIGVSDSLYKGGRVLVELMNEKLFRLKPYYSLREGELLNLGTLPAGRYRLRIIYDRNENGRWDTGDFRNRRLPEEIILLSQVIELRPGLAQKIIWNPYEKKSKL